LANKKLIVILGKNVDGVGEEIKRRWRYMMPTAITLRKYNPPPPGADVNPILKTPTWMLMSHGKGSIPTPQGSHVKTKHLNHYCGFIYLLIWGVRVGAQGPS
jgi:hypothetical protein